MTQQIRANSKWSTGRNLWKSSFNRMLGNHINPLSGQQCFVVKTKLRDLLGSDDWADVYNQIQQFMMLSLYDYGVEIGPLKLLPESQ